MITQNRWQHILGVARKCKEYAAKLRPDDSQFAEDMFVLGMLHDMGYEFNQISKQYFISKQTFGISE